MSLTALPPDWTALLRDQGRSMTWLAQQVGVSRTYLADVAAGRKHASPELQERIALALRPSPDRLASIRVYADERAAWREVERQAIALAAAIRAALGEGPQ
jgi:transcriptional regulator with XRE-family HTH domain